MIDDQLADFSQNDPTNTAENSTEIQNLIRRKWELEKRHKLQTQKDQRVQEILEQTHISQCIEVRPKYLIPDTNCFIDFLDQVKILATATNSYFLLVPTVGMFVRFVLRFDFKTRTEFQLSTKSKDCRRECRWME